jgi:Protein of unknown function (DUF1579)
MLKKLHLLTIVACLMFSNAASAQQEQPDVAAMMKKMEEHATPGQHHEMLAGLVGKWKTSMTMMGMAPTPGTAEYTSILGGRYIQQTFEGSMMGRPYSGMGLLGYDNYKKKFTSTFIDSLSTTKNHAEGLLDQTGKIISFYGSMDEYLTGEHDKPVKYVLDMTDPERVVFEVHDLAIGVNSKVVEIVYERIREGNNAKK